MEVGGRGDGTGTGREVFSTKYGERVERGPEGQENEWKFLGWHL